MGKLIWQFQGVLEFHGVYEFTVDPLDPQLAGTPTPCPHATHAGTQAGEASPAGDPA